MSYRAPERYRTKVFEAVSGALKRGGPRHWTHYWSNDTWDREKAISEGDGYRHTAGNQFRKRGVSPGDSIYLVSVFEGRLFLGARMRAGQVLGQEEAARILGTTELWAADDHVIAEPGTETTLRFNRKVPTSVVERLRFRRGNTLLPPTFTGPGVLDGQTMRGVRELSSEAAALLDGVILEG